MDAESFEGWAIVELMGHRRLAGYLREEVVAGAAFLRLDIPKTTRSEANDLAATQLYSAAAVYCITPTTEQIARNIAVNSQPAPVQRWELSAPHECEDDQ